MSKNDDLERIVRLSCLVEDRTDQEQRSLLRLADEIDHHWNRKTTGNPNYHYRTDSLDKISELYDLAQDTRDVQEGQKVVELSKRKGTVRAT